MSAEQIAELDYNIRVNHENTDILFNVTNSNTEVLGIITDLMRDVNFYYMVMIILMSIGMYLMSRWVEKLEERITQLEESRPEKEPLLATF